MRLKAILIVLLYLSMHSCSPIKNSLLDTEQIAVGPGPEDMLIQEDALGKRILISCAARRDEHETFGEIMSYRPESGEIKTLIRSGMPDSLFFQPHGVYLDSNSNPDRLFVISHEHDQGFHPIYVWKVKGDTLNFSELIVSPLLHSPNALCMGPLGELYVVNDAGERGNNLEKIIKLKRANIVKLEREARNNWKAEIAADRLGYPAGINRIGNTLYAGDAILNQLHVYSIDKGQLIPLESIEDLTGNDNIRVINNKLIITGHIKPFKLISHMKSAENPSPVKVWEYDPKSNEVRTIFQTDGSLISAGSTALILDHYLYVSQIMEAFILKIAPR
ncbi:hypothetical protein ACFLT1_00465 [Bacteroidota bacterium]